MITKTYYSIRNNGDGSAGLALVESKELAILDQEAENAFGEGWAESCYGWITLESDTPIIIKGEVETAQGMIKEIEEELEEDYMKEYKAEGKYPEWFLRLEQKLKALKHLIAVREE